MSKKILGRSGVRGDPGATQRGSDQPVRFFGSPRRLNSKMLQIYPIFANFFLPILTVLLQKFFQILTKIF